jgi:hypothetical protein
MIVALVNHFYVGFAPFATEALRRCSGSWWATLRREQAQQGSPLFDHLVGAAVLVGVCSMP